MYGTVGCQILPDFRRTFLAPENRLPKNLGNLRLCFSNQYFGLQQNTGLYSAAGGRRRRSPLRRYCYRCRWYRTARHRARGNRLAGGHRNLMRRRTACYPDCQRGKNSGNTYHGTTNSRFFAILPTRFLYR